MNPKILSSTDFSENFSLKIKAKVVFKKEIRGQIIEFPSSGSAIISISDRLPLVPKTSYAMFILLTLQQN